MSLAAIVQAMADNGCSPQQIAAAVRAHEEAAPVRSKHAEAQARYRAKKVAEVITGDHGDHDDHIEVSEKESSPHTPLKEKPLPKENPPKGGQKKGVRLPADWQPTADDRDYGARLGFSTSEIDGMAEDLRLWASAASGQVALKRDWGSAFKGWMRRDARKRPANGGKLALVPASPQDRNAALAKQGQRWVEYDTQEWSRVADIWKAEKGMYPPHPNGGWYFPVSYFPPAQGAAA